MSLTTIPIDYQRLDAWPADAPKAEFEKSPWYVFDGLNDLIERELRMRNAASAVLQMSLLERYIGRDGLALANAPDTLRAGLHPGVILTVSLGEKRFLRFPAAKYMTWRANLRAIGQCMEHLRFISRDGVGTGEEQYAGYELVFKPSAAPVGDPPRMKMGSGLSRPMVDGEPIFVGGKELSALAFSAVSLILECAGEPVSLDSIRLFFGNGDYQARVRREGFRRFHPDLVGVESKTAAHETMVELGMAWNLIGGRS